ncbi:MAG: EamA family transporter RarD, partial [Caldilineae bacterium]
MNRGLVYAFLAYFAWGVLPIYWKLLKHVPAQEILGHRVLWSLVILVGILAARREWAWIRRLNRRDLVRFVAISGLLIVNWYVYIWAVNAGFIVETSLGYFMNPLVNVLLGVLFLRERPRAWQLVAIGIAASGVLYLTFSYGALPWIGLTLAFSFGLYGLLKKTAALNALEGLSLEMALLAPAAILFLLWFQQQPGSVTHELGLGSWLLLAGTGLITAGPLLSFAAAARRITLTALGLMQYMAPTMQFLIGVFLYNEPFNAARGVGFALIWMALILYTAESIVHVRRRRA